jgi:hypothetical protein
MTRKEAERKIMDIRLRHRLYTSLELVTATVDMLVEFGLLKLDEPKPQVRIAEAIARALTTSNGHLYQQETFVEQLDKLGYEIRPKQTHSY